MRDLPRRILNMTNTLEKMRVGVKRKSGLSPDSEYEQTFGVRHRRSGRPNKDDGGEVMFPAGNDNPFLVTIAQRRAYAVVHEKYKAELSAIFASELAVLRKRGIKQVAADAGYDYEESDDSSELEGGV